MNKRGNVAFLLLPVIALVFSLIALFAFLSFGDNFDNRSGQLNTLMNKVELSERYVIAKSELIVANTLNCDKKTFGVICDEQDLKKRMIGIAAKSDYNYDGQGNLFAKFRNGEFKFENIDGGYELVIESLFIQVSVISEGDRNPSKVTRNFDLNIKFDDRGGVIFEKVQFK